MNKKEDELLWIAVYTKPRAEKLVAQRVTEVRDHPMESYLPLQRKLHKWSDRKKWVEVPLFSSYVFVHAKPKDFHWVGEVEGVACVVRFGNKASIIPDREIDYIRRLIEMEMDVAVHNAMSLSKGVRAKIISGPLEGYEGQLVSDCRDGNFSVSVTGLNVNLVVDVPKDMLEVVGNGPEKEPNADKYHF